MGRLDVHIRHGGDGAGPWAALAVLVVLAIAGGAARHVIGDVARVLVTVLEVIGWTLIASASAAAWPAAGCWPGCGSAVVRAARAPRAMPQHHAPVIQITPEGYVQPLPDRARRGPARARPPTAATGGGVAAARLVGGDPSADRR